MSRFIRLSDVMDEGSPDFGDEAPDTVPAPPTGDEFWRAPSGYMYSHRETAWDAINEMTQDGSNEDFMEQALASGLPLQQIPANECVWVARSRGEVEHYNRDENGQPSPDIYSFRPESYKVIIPDDGDGGMYIWTPGMGSQASTRPSRFIRLAARNLSRQRAQDVLLQSRYDKALADGVPTDDPLMQELRARIHGRKLDTREQGVMTFPETDEPWAGETNPVVAGRMRHQYILSINNKLNTLGGRMSSEERGNVDRLNGIILTSTDPKAVSQAYAEVEGLMRELPNRPEPEPYTPRFVRPVPTSMT